MDILGVVQENIVAVVGNGRVQKDDTCVNNVL